MNTSGTVSVNWTKINHRNSELIKRVYRKHVLGDDSIGWEELSDDLRDTLCESMGDDEFCQWLESVETSKR